MTDASGGAVTGARISATNLDQQRVVRTVESDATGNYAVPNLPIGRYTLTTEASGFKKDVRTDIVLKSTTG